MLLGEHLTSLFNIKQEDIERALTVKKKVGGYLGQILIQQGITTETQLVRALSEQLGLPVFDIDAHPVGLENIVASLDRELDLDFIVKNNFVPVAFDRE